MSLSIGKRRGLAQCATPQGALAILALDHRDSMRRAMLPGDPDSVPYGRMVVFKQQVVRALAPYSSAVLLDPEIGAAPNVAGDTLPGSVGLLVALEATGYIDGSSARRNRVLPGWRVGRIRRMGRSPEGNDHRWRSDKGKRCHLLGPDWSEWRLLHPHGHQEAG